MEQKGELISYRPDIKVVDCTIRDGGLVNNFYFDDEFVRNLYTANVAAGVEYMEFGYKASKEIFDVKEFGKWKFCDEQDIRDIVGDNNTDLKISVMADVGRTDYKKDIIPKTDSVIDMIRIATYINTIPAAIEMIHYVRRWAMKPRLILWQFPQRQNLSWIWHWIYWHRARSARFIWLTARFFISGTDPQTGG